MMAARVQTSFNDDRRLYNELHQLYPEVAETDIVSLMKDNDCDREKCLTALVQKSNQILYGPECTTPTHFGDQLDRLHLSPPSQTPSRLPLHDATNRHSPVNRPGATQLQLTPDSQQYLTQQTHYIQRPQTIQTSQFPPPTDPCRQTPDGHGPRYVSQIDVEAQNSGCTVAQYRYMPPPHHPPGSQQGYEPSTGTCAIRQPPVSLQIHSSNAPVVSTHHNILAERPGQFSQPFPVRTVSTLDGERQKQLYTAPATARTEAYLTNQHSYVQQSPQHPSPRSQTAFSRYCATKFIQVSPAEQIPPEFYIHPQKPPAVSSRQAPYSQTPPQIDLLTSPDPEVARIQQPPLQPVPSQLNHDTARASLLQTEGVGPWPATPLSDMPANEAEYRQTLLQYQAQRKHKLEQDMSESRSHLEQLRREVTAMEQEQLERRRRSRSYPFPQAHDVQSVREANRKLQIDIKIMAAQVDMVTNGQTPLGILDATEQQRFYSNFNPGQHGPINQSVPSHPHTAPQHPVTPPPPYVPPDDVNQWSCSACTFLNHPQLDKCEVCEMPRVSVGFT